MTAGDARDVNAVTHIIDPWPRYVRNRRIPGDGQRMVRAIERYKNGGRPVVSGGGAGVGMGGGADSTGGGMGGGGIGAGIGGGGGGMGGGGGY